MKRFKVTPEIKGLLYSYKKKTVFIQAYPPDTEYHIDSYWDGGSKTTYTLINLLGSCSFPTPEKSSKGYPGNYYKLRPGEILLSTGFFCGKPATAGFAFREDDKEAVFRLLGNPEEEDSK